jgi:hypothetical protein
LAPSRFPGDREEKVMRIGRLPNSLRALGVATLVTISVIGAASNQPVRVAIADFDYTDTSNEPRSQAGEHARRLADFVKALRADISATGPFMSVEIACASPPCTAGDTPAAALIGAAKAAGARLLVYGGIEKMSALIQWGKMQVVDLQTDRLVDDKMITFRGDSDEAWAHAAAFVIEGIKDLDVSK